MKKDSKHCDRRHPHVLKTLRHRYDSVTFYGCNSLCCASFVKQLTNYRKKHKEVAARSFVYVYGYDNRKEAVTNTIGIPLSERLDGFIRNFKVLPLEEISVSGKASKPVTVGCIDATLEDIACFEASFYFLDMEDLYTWVVQDGCFALHADRSTLWPKASTLQRCKWLRVQEHYKISEAKLRRDREGAEVLAKYLRSQQDVTLVEVAAEGMKSFRQSCEKHDTLSKYMVNQICRFITTVANQKNNRLGTAVVYALEALSFVSHGPRNAKTLAFVMDQISDNTIRNLHPHILWAGLVTVRELAGQGRFLDKLRARQSTIRALPVIRKIHKSRKGTPGFRRLLVDMLDMLGSTRKAKAKARHQFDAFLSHVSEDKEKIIIPFYRSMKKRNLKPWLDTMEKGWGKEINKKIGQGILESKLFVVFITEAFLKRHNWASHELSIALEIERRTRRLLVLPILIGISKPILHRKLPWFPHDKLCKMVHVEDLFNSRRSRVLGEIIGELQRIIKADC